jgi:hypothetical protein
VGGNPGLAGQPTSHLFPIGLSQGASGKLAEVATDFMFRESTTSAKAPALRLDKLKPTIERLFKACQLGFQGKGELNTEFLKLADMELFAQAAGAVLVGANWGN